MDAAKLIQDSHHFATNAVEADKEGNYQVAIFCYIEAAESIKTALDIDRSLSPVLHNNAVQYLERAESLHTQCSKLLFLLHIYIDVSLELELFFNYGSKHIAQTNEFPVFSCC